LPYSANISVENVFLKNFWVRKNMNRKIIINMNSTYKIGDSNKYEWFIDIEWIIFGIKNNIIK
jgi:hypothetical protein